MQAGLDTFAPVAGVARDPGQQPVPLRKQPIRRVADGLRKRIPALREAVEYRLSIAGRG